MASHREVIPNYAAIGPMCVEKIGPEMQRLGCKCPPPGYCFTVEHNKEYTATNIDKLFYFVQISDFYVHVRIHFLKKILKSGSNRHLSC